jgi:hypothetical protein
MADLNLVILVDRDKRKQIDAVAENLSKAGLQVDRKMSLTGVISGKAPAEKLESLRKVEGVAELREESVYELPPMDEKIPQ